MATKQVLKMLAATFTAAQWKAFLSTTGVGYADMAGEIQPALFQALFPGGHLVCVKDSPSGPDDPNAKRDISGDALTSARLRLRYFVSLALQIADNPDSHTFFARVAPDGAPPHFFMLNAREGDVDREFGAAVREKVPNVLKPGQVFFAAPIWRVPSPWTAASARWTTWSRASGGRRAAGCTPTRVMEKEASPSPGPPLLPALPTCCAPSPCASAGRTAWSDPPPP